jgi:hypothetical protein
MKLIGLIVLIIALAIPASASSVVSWMQEDITGYNLTLNYTSEFNVAKDDILGISIINRGNETLNDTITINKIQVTNTSDADGTWTGSVIIEPDSSDTISFDLNVTTDDEETVNIRIYYKVNSEDATNTLNVKANYPGASEITPWNNKSNSVTTTLTVNTSEAIRFNATANHLVNSWNINVLEKEGKNKKATILDWYPEVVDYVYVNGTVNETIEYSITTLEKMAMFNWTVDGTQVTGYAVDNTYYYEHTWDNNSCLGAHTIIFKGSNNDTRVEFRWYVNVYRKGEEEHGSGSIFDIIDDAIENHVTDIKIRMFKYKIAKHAGKSEIAAQKVNQLHDEIAKRQMTREALRAEFKAGNITAENYTAAMKQLQREAKYNSKLAKGYAKISIEDLKDDKSENDFKKISEMETKNDKRKDGTNSKGKEEASNKGKEDTGTKGKSKGNNKDNEHKNNGRGQGLSKP